MAQVIIDVETAYNMIQQKHGLHTFLHTYLGSLTIIPLGYFVVWVFNKFIRNFKFEGIQKLFAEEINWKVLLYSMLVGCWSHVFLDSIMHSDVRPFWPFSSSNELNELIDVGFLHLICTGAGMLGLIWVNREEIKKGFK